MHTTPLPPEDRPNSIDSLNPTRSQTPVECASDVDPNHWSCTLDYGSLPTIPFSCLPLRVQHIIGYRVSKSPCPLFVLIVSNRNQWCLVQLSDDSATESPTKTRLHETDTDDVMNLPTSSQLHQATLVLSIDECTEARFVGPRVTFHLTSPESVDTWKCPFCGSAFFMGTDASGRTVIEQHLRLHLELRCCIDCATILSNTTWSVCSSLAIPHECSQLISHPETRPNCVSSTWTPVQVPSPAGPTAVATPSPVLSEPVTRIDPPSHDNKLLSRALPNQAGAVLLLYQNSHLTTLFRPQRGVRGSCIPEKYCQHCNVEFETSEKYHQHRKNVHRPFRHMCPECGISFSTKGNLTKHFLSVHNQATASQCTLCEKQFPNRYNMERHIQLAHSNTMTDPHLHVGETTPASIPNPFSEPGPIVLKPETSSADQVEGGSALPCASPAISSAMNSRGFYLYLSEASSVATAAPEITTLELCTENASSLTPPSQSALVAEVHLTPCAPSNPEAQYGLLESAWRQSVRLPNNFAGSNL